MLSTLERTFGFYPISIATSMAFEGITRVGEYRDRPGEPELDHLQAIAVTHPANRSRINLGLLLLHRHAFAARILLRYHRRRKTAAQ